MMELTPKNVEDIFTDCLLNEDYKDDDKVLSVVSVIGIFGFDPVKIEKNSESIHELVSQLNSKFDEENQGYTFLNLPFKGENEEQWGEQRHAGLLMALGIASGWMQYTLPDPKMWVILPGGVPYVYRLNKRKDMSGEILTVGEVKKNAKTN